MVKKIKKIKVTGNLGIISHILPWRLVPRFQDTSCSFYFFLFYQGIRKMSERGPRWS